MRVQHRLPSPPFHPHAHQTAPAPQDYAQAQPNGVHSDPSRPRYSASTTDHLNTEDMYSQAHSYGAGNGQPQQHYQQHPQHQQQRQYAPQNENQLPPMHNGMMPPNMSMPPPSQGSGQGVAGPSSGQHPVLYPATSSGLPQPGARALEAQNTNGPNALSGNNGKYRFELRVEQQPARARMCGFGDKDRRPITPPPCVRLVIFDLGTGEEVPHEKVDGTFFVLQVDLWDENATREVNIVRSSSTSPAISISTATTTSYPPTAERGHGFYQEVPPGIYQTADGFQVVGAAAGYGQPQFAYSRSFGPPGSGLPPYANSQYHPPAFQHQPGHPPQPVNVIPLVSMPGQNGNNMFTRNLIGSLTVNAASLRDPEGNLGYWFVLQDLSVRTEGWFRLKMNFIDVGAQSGGGLNKTRAPVLAYVYSDKFQVYSAKKFPGVIESTELSKAFAQQGIKIPIRKDGKGDKDQDED